MPQKNTANKRRFKVLIVNDSPMLTAVLNAILSSEPEYQIIACAADGNEAINAFKKEQADIVLMDIHMPNMGGVTATKEICSCWPKTRIIIVTATVTANMTYIFSALNSGAMDYVQTPTLPFKAGESVPKNELQKSGQRLLSKLKCLRNLTLAPACLPSQERSARPRPLSFSQNKTSNTTACWSGQARRSGHPVQTAQTGYAAHDSNVIAIGTSTGGPNALATLLKKIPSNPSCPIVVCQHIEPGFIGDFSAWLETECGINTVIAKNGEKLMAGCISIAPAGLNLSLTATGRFEVTAPLADQYYTPNINVLFSSLAKHFGKRALGLVLTGMGDDGALGAKDIVAQGGSVLIQAPDSALIDSMPRRTQEAINSHTSYQLNQLSVMMERWMTSSTRIKGL